MENFNIEGWDKLHSATTGEWFYTFLSLDRKCMIQRCAFDSDWELVPVTNIGNEINKFYEIYGHIPKGDFDFIKEKAKLWKINITLQI